MRTTAEGGHPTVRVVATRFEGAKKPKKTKGAVPS